MNDIKRLNSYEDLPLVLDVADIQQMCIRDSTDFIRGIRSQTDKLDFLFQALVKTSRLETGDVYKRQVLLSFLEEMRLLKSLGILNMMQDLVRHGLLIDVYKRQPE